MLNNVSPIQSFYRKRFSKILVPTLFFSILYYFAHFIIKKGPGPSEFLPNLLKGPVIYHLWYMYLLLGIYLVIPFFQRLYASSSESDLKILIGIWFVFGILLPNIKEVTGLDISANGYAEASEFFSYLGYVLWGGFMKKHAINVSMIKTKILASLALVFVSTVAITHWKQKADEAFFVYNSVFVFFYSTYLFHWISKTPVRSLPNIVLLLNNSSFGIYLVHVFYLVLFNNIGFTGNFIHPSLGIPICASAIFTISFLTIHIARKVPILRAVTG
jgi:surface polysaccharide O-acyltransferase-like enzyme